MRTVELRLVKCPPPRHFPEMVKLSRSLFRLIVEEYGTDGALERLADPRWFQSLACLLGYERDTSGSTTVVTAALREALDPEEHGMVVAGGKGRLALETPKRVRELADRMDVDPRPLVTASRLTARSDSACLQDGHDLYHHAIVFDENGRWVVIQQGMDVDRKTARRYHWLDSEVSEFVEGHPVVADETREVLSLQGNRADKCREVVLDLVKGGPDCVLREWRIVKSSISGPLDDYLGGEGGVKVPDGWVPRRLDRDVLRYLYEIDPADFKEFLTVRGVGPSLVRALALIAEIVHGEGPDRRDPAEYTTAFGCKSGDPYPVHRDLMRLAAELIERTGSSRLRRFLERNKIPV
ncbi:DUF763 domain-containing protein [Methanopyrus sp.]